MELLQLDRISFKLRVTCIDRQGTDRLINLANEFSTAMCTRAPILLEDGDTFSAISGLAEAAKTKFCLYCLAIINCYATLENNRNEIVGEKIFKIEKLDSFLKHKGINHQKVRCYKTMNEFRLVNNAIKHSRLSGTTAVLAKNGKNYGPKQMESLYKKSKHLDSYLSDLFRIVEKSA